MNTAVTSESGTPQVNERVTHISDPDKPLASLSPAHSAYLLKRHGTTELDPLPAPTDADPLNWPTWKKIPNLAFVSFHAGMGPFTGASIIPAFEAISQDLGVSLQSASYLTGLQIAILGVAPLLWLPLADRFGRRPIFLISLLGSLICNIGAAKIPSYHSVATCLALVAFFISPAGAIGSGVVRDTFFKKGRARSMGAWALMVTIGVPLSPFLFGFVVPRAGYRWIFWTNAMINGVRLLLYMFLSPETIYVHSSFLDTKSTFTQKYLLLKRIDQAPLRFSSFTHPLGYFFQYRVLIPAVAYVMIFLFGNVLITVEIPQLFVPKWHFDAQAVGLQFIALILGSVMGEHIGGSLSDYWMDWGTKRNNGIRPSNEHRLWLSYIGFALTACGVVVVLVMTQQLATYNVVPVVGAGIAAAGNQIVTTVLITYSVDCYT